ncbi:MAG: DUF2339 domain-containing protein [Candidatus Pacebacteria bacterium]|jgi:uncharacterized membrane protein|nr:DUF2339 domain-containing protein [Candidatus Paceibacterota bacterium]
MFEFELFVFVVILFVFLYSKSRIDELRDIVNNLQAKLGVAVRQREAGPEVPVAKTEEPPPVAQEMPVEVMRELAQQGAASETIKQNAGGQREDLEFKIGSKIFTAVGVIAVLFAIGFFLRYAFDSGLINETGRVVLGVFAGLALLAVGELTCKKFPSYGQVLTGGGLGILYLSFFAAFSLYEKMTAPVAFFAMILVTAAGIALSLRQNSMALAMFAQIGGFLTPMLINDGSNNPHILFLYVVLLDLAVFMIAFYKLWQPLSVVCFIGTIVSYIGWYSAFYNSPQFVLAQGYLSLFFAVFLCIPFIQYFVKKSPENSWDMALVSFNPIFYFGMSYALINPLYHDIMGAFTAILGAFYCFLAYVVGGANERDSLFRHFLLTAGFVLLAIAVPVQFEGKWIVVAWSAEALAFIITGFRMKFPLYRALGHLLFFLTLFRLLFFEGNLPVLAMPILNTRLLLYAIFFGAVVAASYVYRKKRAELGEDEKSLVSVLELGASFTFLMGLSLEVHDFFESYLYPMLWTAGGLAAALLSFKINSKTLRVVAYITFIASFFRLLFFESGIELANYMPIFNARVLAFAFCAAAFRGYLSLLRYRKDKVSSDELGFFNPTLFLVFHFLVLWVLSAEIISLCDREATYAAGTAAFDFENLKNVFLSVAWTFYGIGLLITGIVRKAVYNRFLGLALLGIVIFKVFLVDTANLSDLYRFFSFIVLGCLLLVAGYLYYRYQDRIRDFVKGK